MEEAAQILAEARREASKGNMEGAISFLSGELESFSGELEDRRSIVALLLTYCGRREQISQGIKIAQEHFTIDPISVVDSSVKSRVIMNFAALKAASGDIDGAIAILGNLLILAASANVDEDDLTRVRVMLESLKIAEDKSTADANFSPAYGNRLQAYLASAYISQLIQGESFTEAVRLARATLDNNPDLEEGPLKITLALNLGIGLEGERKQGEAGEWLARSYEAANWTIMRSGTLFGLVARSYADWLYRMGQVSRSIEIVEDLLEAQLPRFGASGSEVMISQALLSKLKDPGGTG